MSNRMNSMEKLSPVELIVGLRDSKSLGYSPVAFVVDLLDSYVQEKFTAQELCSQYALKTRNAQFYFSHMPLHDVEENRRVFGKEFAFADSLTAVLIRKTALPGTPAFDKSLCECMESYLASLKL